MVWLARLDAQECLENALDVFIGHGSIHLVCDMLCLGLRGHIAKGFLKSFDLESSGSHTVRLTGHPSQEAALHNFTQYHDGRLPWLFCLLRSGQLVKTPPLQTKAAAPTLPSQRTSDLWHS